MVLLFRLLFELKVCNRDDDMRLIRIALLYQIISASMTKSLQMQLVIQGPLSVSALLEELVRIS